MGRTLFCDEKKHIGVVIINNVKTMVPFPFIIDCIAVLIDNKKETMITMVGFTEFLIVVDPSLKGSVFFLPALCVIVVLLQIWEISFQYK